MGKLHELLAVETDVKGAFLSTMKETIKTFQKKVSIFQGSEKVLQTPTSDGSVEKEVVARQELTDTVVSKLEYQSDFIIRFLDIYLQKESANQEAKAIIQIDGKDFLGALPATFLLGMESLLKQIRMVYQSIPTLEQGIKWEKDSLLGKNIYRKVHPDEANKTAKTFQHKVLVPAMFPKEGEGGTSLPAQIEKWEETIVIGKYSTESHSGMISSAQKSQLLGNIDKLSVAVKKARQRANCQEIKKIKIGKEIINFIHNGLN